MSTDDGWGRFQRRLAAIPKAVREAVTPAVVKSAEEMAKAARRNAEASRDTGALIDSIAVTGPGEQTPPYSQPGGSYSTGEMEAVVTAGNSDVRYAHIVEYGSTTDQAQPYFWPAHRELQKRSANRIKRVGRKAIKEAGK